MTQPKQTKMSEQKEVKTWGLWLSPFNARILTEFDMQVAQNKEFIESLTLVVPKSDFTALQEELQAHQIEMERLLDLVIAKDKEIARLREALEFYANEMNYSVDDYHGISGEMRRRCVLYSDCEERNEVYSYAGMIARKALKGEM